MKLLLDANLSWKLVAKFSVSFPGSIHVNHTGLSQPASDISIWNYALENDYTIVTNDEDFLRLSLSHSFPPKVVLLRTGNQSTLECYNTILTQKVAIEELLTNPTLGILEIY
jgi:predicted nuclease of predicted toxin-antitoxin system